MKLLVTSFKLELELSQSKEFSTTIRILDIVYFLVNYLKHDVSVTGFCGRPQVDPTHLGPIDIVSFCLQTPAPTLIEFIKPIQHKATTRINILHILNLQTCET
jgi:hypothetical protein